MELELYRQLVWTDYRLAVLFAVLVPLVLLVWAFVLKNEAMQHLLTIYWRVSSLLLVTVYLMIAALPIGFVSGLLARILIPISLWFWADLNEEIEDQRRTPLKWTLTSWRWGITIYCGLGVLFQLTSVRCALMPKAAMVDSPFCQAWLGPPWGFKEYFHANTGVGFLGFLGVAGLVIYVLYLSYFVFFRLGRQGRSATQQ